jgi:hypothetical protein
LEDTITRNAQVDDAPALVAAEKETARTAGLLVSRPHELALLREINWL